MKRKSVLYTESYRKAARTNNDPAAVKLRQELIEKAAYWDDMSDDELWELMFGYTIKRSLMVRSDGKCPDCGKPVPMYTWRIDAKNVRWKVQCPHCGASFPKNDFEAYMKSGLDEYGIFRHHLADESLLASHMDEEAFRAARLYPEGYSDAAYVKGIDDGDGSMDGWCAPGGKRYYFIAAYAAYGQWKQLVVEGILALAQAYLVTGQQRYAHKAAVMLDRVADLLPMFDYHRQGVLYEIPGDMGYVTTWHESNRELTALVLAYDMIFDGLQGDGALVAFLREKSRQYKVVNPKESIDNIIYNIDTRILRDMLRNPRKITQNYPGTEITVLMVRLILDDPAETERAWGEAKAILRDATAADGMTGERGIGGYASITASSTLLTLETILLADPDMAKQCIAETPALVKTFHFLNDLYLGNRFYPKVGDTAGIGLPMDYFSFIDFTHRINPDTITPGFNLYSFLWRLYTLTGNDFYLSILRRKAKEGGAVCDIGESDAKAFYETIAAPDDSTAKSVLFPKWQVATLVSEHSAAWMHFLPYTERHSHTDTFHTGLVAYGMELLPDFGYPPVQYGGWHTPKTYWYKSPWVHNGVIVDGDRIPRASYTDPDPKPADITLWRTEPDYTALSVAADGLYGTKTYDRTLVQLTLDGGMSVLLDVSRVETDTPTEQIRVIPTNFGTLTTSFAGDDTLTLDERLLFGPIKGQKCVKNGPQTAETRFADHNHLPDVPEDVRLKLFELTNDRELYETSLWVNDGDYSIQKPDYIPGILVRRNAAVSAFAAAYVPYAGNDCPVASVTYADNTFTVVTAEDKTVTVTLSYNASHGGAKDICVTG